jgi:hypothetical protein
MRATGAGAVPAPVGSTAKCCVPETPRERHTAARPSRAAASDLEHLLAILHRGSFSSDRSIVVLSKLVPPHEGFRAYSEQCPFCKLRQLGVRPIYLPSLPCMEHVPATVTIDPGCQVSITTYTTSHRPPGDGPRFRYCCAAKWSSNKRHTLRREEPSALQITHHRSGSCLALVPGPRHYCRGPARAPTSVSDVLGRRHLVE